jgi:hypothetical protein
MTGRAWLNALLGTVLIAAVVIGFLAAGGIL